MGCDVDCGWLVNVVPFKIAPHDRHCTVLQLSPRRSRGQMSSIGYPFGFSFAY
jgi:hypothetical protein